MNTFCFIKTALGTVQIFSFCVIKFLYFSNLLINVLQMLNEKSFIWGHFSKSFMHILLHWLFKLFATLPSALLSHFKISKTKNVLYSLKYHIWWPVRFIFFPLPLFIFSILQYYGYFDWNFVLDPLFCPPR